MELPAYRRPKLTSVLRRMFGAGWAFTLRAGTIILAAMVLVGMWLLLISGGLLLLALAGLVRE